MFSTTITEPSSFFCWPDMHFKHEISSAINRTQVLVFFVNFIHFFWVKFQQSRYNFWFGFFSSFFCWWWRSKVTDSSSIHTFFSDNFHSSTIILISLVSSYHHQRGRLSENYFKASPSSLNLSFFNGEQPFLLKRIENLRKQLYSRVERTILKLLYLPDDVDHHNHWCETPLTIFHCVLTKNIKKN